MDSFMAVYGLPCPYYPRLSYQGSLLVFCIGFGKSPPLFDFESKATRDSFYYDPLMSEFAYHFLLLLI